MRTLWKLLRRHLSVAQLAGFFVTNLVGIFIILAAVQLYSDVRPVFTQPDSFMKGDYRIISKKVGSLQALGIGSSDFTAAELDELRGQSFVHRVGVFTPAAYRVRGSVGMGDMDIVTYLFFESVPDEFLDVNTSEWRWHPGDSEIPIILPRNYLSLYNYGFARSQGLPQISENLFRKVNLGIQISGNGLTEDFRGKVVGFSNRLNTILVPQSFIEWSNARFAGGGAGNPSRVIAQVDLGADDAVQNYLDGKGYETEGERAEAGKSMHFLRLATAVVVGVGLLISALSIFILMLSIFLLLQKNTRKLETLLLLGYTPGQVARPYQLLTLGLNGAVLLLAVAGVLIARTGWLPVLSTLLEAYAPGSVGMMLGAGLVLTIAVTVLNALAIRRKVASLWIRKG